MSDWRFAADMQAGGDLVGGASKGDIGHVRQNYPPFRARDDAAIYACPAATSIPAQL
jgi:hypothetical protein